MAKITLNLDSLTIGEVALGKQFNTSFLEEKVHCTTRLNKLLNVWSTKFPEYGLSVLTKDGSVTSIVVVFNHIEGNKFTDRNTVDFLNNFVGDFYFKKELVSIDRYSPPKEISQLFGQASVEFEDDNQYTAEYEMAIEHVNLEFLWDRKGNEWLLRFLEIEYHGQPSLV